MYDEGDATEPPAIVTGTLDIGESDRIVRLLSAARGRHPVVVRRARSSRSRFPGVFEPGNVVRVEAKGRGDLRSVVRADLIRVPRRARDDLSRLAHLAYGTEVCAALAPEDAPAERLFGLLSSWLDVVDGDPAPGGAARIALEAKVLTFAGLAPRLLRCARCGELLADPVTWSSDAGGGQHAACGEGEPVEARLLEAIEALRRLPLSEAAKLPDLGASLLTDAIEHQLGRGLASRALLDLADRPPG